MHKAVVYALNDPITGWIRYIGKTSISPSARLKNHLRQARNGGKFRVHNWIRSLTVLDRYPIMSILQVCKSNEESCQIEKYWILKYKNLCDLTNLTSGGEGTPGRIVSSETRDKMRKIFTGLKRGPHSFEHRQKISLSLRGRKRTPEHCAAISDAKIGKKPSFRSPEHNRKIALAHIGMKLSEETRQKIRVSKIGIKASAQTRALLSSQRKGRLHPFYGKKHSKKSRELISKKATGRKASPATKLKMRESHLRHWGKLPPMDITNKQQKEISI